MSLLTEEQEAKEKLEEKYSPSVWIADAANRCTQIKLVTHVAKYTHPNVKGNNKSLNAQLKKLETTEFLDTAPYMVS